MQIHEILKLEELKAVYNFFKKDAQIWVCSFDTKVKFNEKEKFWFQIEIKLEIDIYTKKVKINISHFGSIIFFVWKWPE